MAGADDIIARESAGDPNAVNSRSSAGGLGQFIDSTWLDMLQRHRPGLMQGRSKADLLQLKFDPQLSRDMTAAYAADNNAALSKAGIPVSAGSTYLAHFAGPQGAIKVLSAAPDTPVANVLDRSAVAANPFLQGMTTADLKAWAEGNKSQKAAKPTVAAPSAPQSDRELGDVLTQMSPYLNPSLTAPRLAFQVDLPPAGSGPSLGYISEKRKRQKAFS